MRASPQTNGVKLEFVERKKRRERPSGIGSGWNNFSRKTEHEISYQHPSRTPRGEEVKESSSRTARHGGNRSQSDRGKNRAPINECHESCIKRRSPPHKYNYGDLNVPGATGTFLSLRPLKWTDFGRKTDIYLPIVVSRLSPACWARAPGSAEGKRCVYTRQIAMIRISERDTAET
ncbi:hypothetical protein J6590_063587 [Homalodisca vitripennis]|nr:hypothetical protein J6590_063587 [Homalodisca vitripennis]